MRKFLLYVLGVSLVVGGLVLVNWPVQNWRLYDANWQALAMTQAENYCAGVQVASLDFQSQLDDESVDACVLASDNDNEKPSIANSQIWFCQGINSVVGGDFPVDACLDTVRDYQIWGLLHGGFTFEWNETGANQYPEIAYDNIKQAPPRGEREDDTVTDRGFR